MSQIVGVGPADRMRSSTTIINQDPSTNGTAIVVVVYITSLSITNEEAVASIEHLLRNIGVFGQLVSHADAAIIVKEQAAEHHEAAIRADTILRQLL